VGNSALGTEKSANVDVGVAWKSGPNRFALNGFVNRFRNFISLESTGNTRAADGTLNPADPTDAVPEFAYRAVPARLVGLEANGSVRLLQGAQTVDLELSADAVRATNRDTGSPTAHREAETAKAHRG